MLYYFFRFLEQFDIPGSHMWAYVSFRSLLTLILSLLLSAWFGEIFIKWMKRRKIFETERDPSIDPFGVEKKGVPTMGGIIIIVSILLPVLLFCRVRNVYILLMIVTTLWLGFLGFLDDYIKIFRRNKEGLPGRFKIVGQVSIGFIVGLTLWLSPDAVVRENVNIRQPDSEVVVKHRSQPVKSLHTTIPFVKNHNLNYSELMSWCGDYRVAAGWVFFVLMTILVVTAVSNGANLNDGMDGMCAGNSAIIGVALGILAYVSSHIGYASYFDIMYIPHSEELVVFLCAFVGAMIGFLWYNAYPAQVFMGDTGSLALGGILGAIAVMSKFELWLIPIGFIYMCETLSVIIQVASFKLTGKKVFKMTPIHHHFELSGWKETKVVTTFALVTFIFSALAVCYFWYWGNL